MVGRRGRRSRRVARRGRVVAFASAIVRERLWYLSMLFVLPELQGAGVGRELLGRVLPDDDGMARATATDSAQPISNGALRLVRHRARGCRCSTCRACRTARRRSGRCRRGSSPVPFDELAAGPADGAGPPACWSRPSTPSIASCSASPTRSTTASCAPSAATAGSTAAPTARRSATATPARPGRLGPVAVRDEALLGPVLGHLTSAVVPRGAFAIWVGGAADRASCRRSGRASGSTLPRPALLGPPVRRLLPLPADLARPALSRRSTDAGPVPRDRRPFAGPWPEW